MTAIILNFPNKNKQQCKRGSNPPPLVGMGDFRLSAISSEKAIEIVEGLEWLLHSIQNARKLERADE